MDYLKTGIQLSKLQRHKTNHLIVLWKSAPGHLDLVNETLTRGCPPFITWCNLPLDQNIWRSYTGKPVVTNDTERRHWTCLVVVKVQSSHLELLKQMHEEKKTIGRRG